MYAFGGGLGEWVAAQRKLEMHEMQERLGLFMDGRIGADGLCGYRTLVYLEGDASMRKYETKDGRTETALSIVQRECYSLYTSLLPNLYGVDLG